MDIRALLAILVTAVSQIAPGGSAQGGPSSTSGLAPFESCDALRQWYVDQGVNRVGPYGWAGFGWRIAAGEAAPQASSDAGSAVPNGSTGTNTQEAGIDEPDVAKTDGRIVVRLWEGSLVVTDVTGTAARQVATWRLPRGAYADQLLLVDDHVLLTAQTGPIAMDDSALPGGTGSEIAEIARTTGTEVFDIDVSDPSNPELVSHTRWSGHLLSLRQYDDTVRMVTMTGLPDLPFVQPGRGISERRATERNREIVRTSTIEQWLPSVRSEGGARQRAVDCSRVFHPAADQGRFEPGTVGVFTLRPGDTSPVSSVAVTGSGTDVYASADRLYVWGADWGLPVPMDSMARTTSRPIMAPPHTSVHAFAIDGEETDYLASGRINGLVRDRWSFDEQDGFLRVAVAWQRRPVTTSDNPDAPVSSGGTSSDNGVVVLDEVGDRLVPVGSLRGLGRNEEIKSVRWFGDLAVLVTFRQIDPLYTIDLSDPARPRTLGELKIPGFSSYLHPIGGDRLLGLGTAATMEGANLGAQAAVFDLSNTSNVRRLDQVELGPETWLAAADDPHAFTWLPSAGGTGVAITQADDGRGSHLEQLRVRPDGTLTTTRLPDVGGYQLRALPLPDGRVALTGERVELVRVG